MSKKDLFGLHRELDDLQSGAIRKGPLPDSRPEGKDSPEDGDLVTL